MISEESALPGSDDNDEFVDSMQVLRDEAVEELQAVLLPEQVERLREIDFRMKIKSQGIIATLQDDSLGLDIDPEQLKEIESRAQELVKEYDLLTKAFKYDFETQIIATLDSEQQARMESLMGPEYSIKDHEGDEQVSDSGRQKEHALEKLEEFRQRIGARK